MLPSGKKEPKAHGAPSRSHFPGQHWGSEQEPEGRADIGHPRQRVAERTEE